MSARARALAAALLLQAKVVEPPIPDSLVAELCGSVCVMLSRLPAGAGGTLYREPPLGSVIWLSRDDTPVERRLPLFHHMGHLTMHPETVFCAMRAPSDWVAEDEADAFASAILMPRRWLRRDAPKVGLDVAVLAERYAVPPVAMARRLRELRLLAAGGSAR